jgi:hypothetical protein
MSKFDKIIGVRLGTYDYDLLKNVCSARGESPSVFIRRTLRNELDHLSYLNSDEKKAKKCSLSQL